MEGGFGRSLSSEPPKIAEDVQESNELFIHMLDSQLPYGYEFYGCDVALALTPITERCFLTLTQVIGVLDKCVTVLFKDNYVSPFLVQSYFAVNSNFPLLYQKSKTLVL